MMTWGNGLIRLVDFLNFSFRIDLCDGGCSPCGLAILRSFKMNFFRSASIFLALRARNMPFLQNKFFVPHPYFSPCGFAEMRSLKMNFFVPHP